MVQTDIDFTRGGQTVTERGRRRERLASTLVPPDFGEQGGGIVQLTAGCQSRLPRLLKDRDHDARALRGNVANGLQPPMLMLRQQGKVGCP